MGRPTAADETNHLSLEHPEVAKKPPENDEDQYRAEASATELLRTISSGDAAQELAHRDPSPIGSALGSAGSVPAARGRSHPATPNESTLLPSARRIHAGRARGRPFVQPG